MSSRQESCKDWEVWVPHRSGSWVSDHGRHRRTHPMMPRIDVDRIMKIASDIDEL